jgi:hypothetical protein
MQALYFKIQKYIIPDYKIKFSLPSETHNHKQSTKYLSKLSRTLDTNIVWYVSLINNFVAHSL